MTNEEPLMDLDDDGDPTTETEDRMAETVAVLAGRLRNDCHFDGPNPAVIGILLFPCGHQLFNADLPTSMDPRMLAHGLIQMGNQLLENIDTSQHPPQHSHGGDLAGIVGDEASFEN